MNICHNRCVVAQARARLIGRNSFMSLFAIGPYLVHQMCLQAFSPQTRHVSPARSLVQAAESCSAVHSCLGFSRILYSEHISCISSFSASFWKADRGDGCSANQNSNRHHRKEAFSPCLVGGESHALVGELLGERSSLQPPQS